MTNALPSPAKINLDLRVVGRGEDGRHLLETRMTFLNWGDDVHLSGRVDGKIWTRWRHPQIRPEAELCARAAKLLKRVSGTRMGADITVFKKIPVGGGMAGGSSNAATTMMGLNRLWRLKLRPAELMKLAAQLGSDLPFFIFGKSARVSGAHGLKMRSITAEKCFFLVATPPVLAATAKVYEAYRAIGAGEIDAPTPAAAALCVNNDLAAAAMHCFPDLASAAEALHSAAGQVNMSGSGGAFFAQFDSEEEALLAQGKMPEDLPSFVAAGKARHPLAFMREEDYDGEEEGVEDKNAPVYEGERPRGYLGG